MAKAGEAARKPVVYHVMLSGRRHVAAASNLATRGARVGIELDPEVVGSRGVFVEVDPGKLRPLDEEGWVYGYPELADRRSLRPRRQRYQAGPPRRPGRRSTDGTGRAL